jgi:hypothetical protein
LFKETMFSYFAYGLGIHSVLPLPELVTSEVAADVVVRLGKVERSATTLDARGCGFWATTDEACHFVEEAGAFLARGGREIIVEPAPNAEARVLRLAILGPTLGLLLHQREFFIVHASAVEVAGTAVAFMGGAGWGKSTLAAVMHGRGHGVVADDITAIDVGTGCPMVSPGFPQLKLWPDALDSLGEVSETLPRLHPLFEKRAHRIVQEFSRSPLPLRCIYVLARGADAAIEPLPAQEALLELVRHWYGARFGMELLRPLGVASVFSQCAQLANTVPVYRLRRPPSLATLADVAGLLEVHLERDVRRASA